MDKILFLPGDGIGPRISESTRRILSAACDGLEFVEGDVGASAYEKTGSFLPHETMELTRECGNVLCGPMDLRAFSSKASRDPLSTLRVQLDLYALCKSFRTLSDDIGTPGVDVALWFCSPVMGRDSVETEELEGITLTKYVRKASYERMMAAAKRHAETDGRTRVACVTSDMFPESSEMFKDCAKDVFGDGFQLTSEDMHRWAAFAIRDPSRYDTVVAADLYGRVAGGILAGLTGGNHLSPNVFVGDGRVLADSGCVKCQADEEHANPTSMIIGGYMTLFGMGRLKEAESVMDALCGAYRAGERTPDVGGCLTTEEFTAAVVRRI